jgi:hypothetical protein
MRQAILSGILIAALAVTASCASDTLYQESIAKGKQLLTAGSYGPARDAFLKAAAAGRDSASLALAAEASYKAGDLAGAERLIREAAVIDRNAASFLRVQGYMALILLAQGKPEGMAALHDYITMYARCFPLDNIHRVDDMWRSRTVNIGTLQTLIDEQVNTYEEEVQQLYTTGTGFLDRGNMAVD